MATEIIDTVWSRPQVRLHAARRSIIQSLEMLTDDTLPRSEQLDRVLDGLRIISSLVAQMEESVRRGG